jgi:hypothetical protein
MNNHPHPFGEKAVNLSDVRQGISLCVRLLNLFSHRLRNLTGTPAPIGTIGWIRTADMSPRHMIDHVTHGLFAYPSLASELSLRDTGSAAGSHLHDESVGQLRNTVAFAARQQVGLRSSAMISSGSNAPTQGRIAHILSVITRRQMIPAHAGRIVAFVQAMARWVNAKLKFVANPVRKIRNARVLFSARRSDIQRTVASLHPIAGPFPAGTLRSLTGSLVYIAPKELGFLFGEFRDATIGFRHRGKLLLSVM